MLLMHFDFLFIYLGMGIRVIGLTSYQMLSDLCLSDLRYEDLIG